MAFEKFHKISPKGRKINKKPSDILSVNLTSTYMGLSIALTDNFIGTKYINMYFDPDARKIGIEFLSGQEDGAYKITFLKSKRGSIGCKGLISAYGLIDATRQSYEVIKDDETGFFVFDLNKPIRYTSKEGSS